MHGNHEYGHARVCRCRTCQPGAVPFLPPAPFPPWMAGVQNGSALQRGSGRLAPGLALTRLGSRQQRHLALPPQALPLPSPADLSLALDSSMLAFVSAELPEGINYVVQTSDFRLSQEAIKAFCECLHPVTPPPHKPKAVGFLHGSVCWLLGREGEGSSTHSLRTGHLTQDRAYLSPAPNRVPGSPAKSGSGLACGSGIGLPLLCTDMVFSCVFCWGCVVFGSMNVSICMPSGSPCLQFYSSLLLVAHAIRVLIRQHGALPAQPPIACSKQKPCRLWPSPLLVLNLAGCIL